MREVMGLEGGSEGVVSFLEPSSREVGFSVI